MSNFSYISFKVIVRAIHDTLLHRHKYIIGRENLPKAGERQFIVCNHQNTGNDPINIVFAMPLTQRPSFMARANIFQVHPLLTRFLRWLGLVPTYRMGFEGADDLQSNFATIQAVADRANEGHPMVIFPEAGHTQGHYLMRFTTGAVRIAFNTAEQNGWKEDVKIVPTATHYGDYFDVQTDFIWMIAPAISLKPYYEEFQQHKASVMRRLTHQLRDTIQSMMLDEGADDYETKDFLRRSALHQPHHDSIPLPERLKLDKAFIARLLAHPHYAEIIRLATDLRQRLQHIGVTDQCVAQAPSLIRTLGFGLILLLLFPLWVVLLWPHLLCYTLPLLLLRTDRMFTNTYRYAISALVIYPLTALITLLVMGLNFGWWCQAILYILLWGITGKLAWFYYRHLREFLIQVRYHLHSSQLPAIRELRTSISQLLAAK